jgi:hypothetical protein
LMTCDNVPSIMAPALTEPRGSLDNVYFFIGFIVVAAYFVLPIPLAVILESFKVNRANQVIAEEIVEKKALLAAFHCLDSEKKGTLTRGEFEELLHYKFNDSTLMLTMVELFDLIDSDKSGELDQLEFFRLSSAMAFAQKSAAVDVDMISEGLDQHIARVQRGGSTILRNGSICGGREGQRLVLSIMGKASSKWVGKMGTGAAAGAGSAVGNGEAGLHALRHAAHARCCAGYAGVCLQTVGSTSQSLCFCAALKHLSCLS